MKEAGRDLSNVVRVSGKFIKDAFLTEVVPRELKLKLKNYDPPKGYLKAVRPFLKMYGGFLAGSVSILMSKDSGLPTAMLRANPFYIYGFGDGIYDLLDTKKYETSLPPATLAIEMPFSYLSNLHKKTKLRSNI